MTCNFNVAAFNRAQSVHAVTVNRVDAFNVNYFRVFENGCPEHGFAVADICCHLADYHVVIHCERCIAHEEQIRNRREYVTFLETFVIIAFNERCCQFFHVKAAEKLHHVRQIFPLANAFYQTFPDFFFLQNIDQQILESQHIGDFTQTSFKVFVVFQRFAIV